MRKLIKKVKLVLPMFTKCTLCTSQMHTTLAQKRQGGGYNWDNLGSRGNIVPDIGQLGLERAWWWCCSLNWCIAGMLCQVTWFQSLWFQWGINAEYWKYFHFARKVGFNFVRLSKIFYETHSWRLVCLAFEEISVPYRRDPHHCI